MEQVTGIEPASPAWKAGALTIVLHLRMPSGEIVSLDMIARNAGTVKRSDGILFEFCKNLCLAEGQKRLEQPAAVQDVADPLRVPLYAPHRQGLVAQRLHRAVRRPLDHPQPGAQAVRRLVVGAVHHAPLSVERPQRRRRGPDAVEPVDAAHITVARQVLDQRAAEKHVDGLESSADAQHRLFHGGEAIHKQQLRRVPFRLQAPGGGVVLPVAPWLHVPAAGQQQSVAPRYAAAEAHPPTGTLHGPLVVPVPRRAAINIDCRHTAPSRGILCPEETVCSCNGEKSVA